MSLVNTGYLKYEELEQLQSVPDEQRYAKGPVAVIECVQQIPCNPCEAACIKKAICVGEPITNLPKVDYDKCIGCGICVAQCSGMAIFIVDKSYSETTATIGFPYEYCPLPKEGDMVKAVNRCGKVVCDAKVLSIRNPESFDHTPVITIEIPKEFADEVRSMKREV